MTHWMKQKIIFPRSPNYWHLKSVVLEEEHILKGDKPEKQRIKKEKEKEKQKIKIKKKKKKEKSFARNEKPTRRKSRDTA